MKKLIFMCLAMLSMVLTTACSGCNKGQDEKTDDVTLITSANFDENLMKIDSVVRHQYPDYAFYEAESHFVNEEGDINPQDMFAAYGKINDMGCLLATVQNDTLVLTKVDENWLEDMFMTALVPMDSKLAVKLLKEKIDVAVSGAPVILRHQLYPGEAEPRFFIGSIAKLHTVGVYTAELDTPLKNGEQAGALAVARDKKVAAE